MFVLEKSLVLKVTILLSFLTKKTYLSILKFIRTNSFVLTKNRWTSMEILVQTSHASFKYNFKSVIRRRKIKTVKTQKKYKTLWETSFCYLSITKKSSNQTVILMIASWSRQICSGFQLIRSSSNRTLIRLQSLIFFFKMMK